MNEPMMFRGSVDDIEELSAQPLLTEYEVSDGIEHDAFTNWMQLEYAE